MDFKTADAILKKHNIEEGECPEGWASLAKDAREKSQFDIEAACWWYGSASCLGHNRAARYEYACRQAEEKM